MEIHYNLAASLIGNLFGILTLVSIMLSSHILKESKNRRYNRWMAFIIVVCIIGCLSEMTFELVNGRVFPFSTQINIIVKTINHLESMYAAFAFLGLMRALIYENEKSWPKYLKIITAIIFTFGTVLMIVNLFTGIVFTINENNMYARGPLGQLGLIISFATLIYIAIILAIDNRNTNTYLRFPVLLYILPFLIGGGLQVTVPSLRLASVSFALGITVAHLSVQRRLLYTDAMTGVFNRAYMVYYFREAVKKEQKATFASLLVDINSFKEINDTLGHAAGDDAIKNSANILRKSVGSQYLVMRYGGDEFMLIKKDGSMEELLSQKARINASVAQFNENHKLPYELSFAIGTVVCEIAQGEFELLIEQLDKSLYRDKKDYYEKTGKERRK